MTKVLAFPTPAAALYPASDSEGEAVRLMLWVPVSLSDRLEAIVNTPGSPWAHVNELVRYSINEQLKLLVEPGP